MIGEEYRDKPFAGQDLGIVHGAGQGCVEKPLWALVQPGLGRSAAKIRKPRFVFFCRRMPARRTIG